MVETKLRKHRRKIAANPNAYTYEVEHDMQRLIGTLARHLKKAGLSVSPKKSYDALAKIIHLLFKAQDQRPIFHIEGTELPLCWNAPRDWNKSFIKYEWGHLRSKTSPPAGLENLALYSARCNQHIQSSMDIEELMVYGGILAQRISNVLTKRRILFSTKEWQETIQHL